MPAIATLEIRRDDGYVFTIDDQYAREGRSLVEGLDGLSRDTGADTIKQNMVRTVYRLERDGTPLFLKRYHSPGLLESLKSLVLPSRAAREWKAMHRLIRAGIPTARPVLFGERRRFGFLKGACFAATEIPGALDFGAFVEQERAAGRWVKEARKAMCGGLARLTAALHRAGVRHGDYHLGNILVSTAGNGALELHLIDLHTVSFPVRLSRADRILNLARIAEVLSVLDGGEDLDDFLDAYRTVAGDPAPSTAALRLKVERRLARLNRRRLRSRTRRCLVESSGFTRARAEDLEMHVRRSFGPDLVARAIRLHDGVAKEGDPRLLHPVFKNKVTVVEAPFQDGTMRLCVKEYRPLPWWKRPFPFLSEARRSWIAGRGLEVRGIATPETVAWVRRGPLEYLVTRYAAEGEHLHRYIAARCRDLAPRQAARMQRALARETAAFVKRMHDSGVRHGDLSEQNILVEEEEGRRAYYIIDCDTVTFGGPPGLRARIKNLVQLGHMPEDVHVLARARFLEHYLGEGRGPVWRSMFREIDRGILMRMIRKRRKFERLRLEDPHPIPSRFRGRW